MVFQPRQIRWIAWDGWEHGVEHAEFRQEPNGNIRIAGTIIGREQGASFALTYQLSLNPAWQTRMAHLQLASGQSLDLESDGRGHWLENGLKQPSLDGCIDIDIQASPVTNTLPIRRLEMGAGETQDIEVAYIEIPSFKVSASPQRYTALETGRLYRFESLSSSFTADLSVDQDGIVQNYPGLFRRIP